MTVHGSDAIVLAPGHAITRSGVRAKEKVLDGLSMEGVLDKVYYIRSRTIGITETLDRSLFGNTAVSNRFHYFLTQKNWPKADKMFLDALAVTRPDYNTLLDAEEWMRAFSGRLCFEARTAHSAYRWLDPPELESYVSGTFESRVESNLTRRGFKALSMNPSLNFDMRRVVLEVPLGHVLRKSIRCVPYTIIPREIDVPDERVSDPKNMAFAAEAEVRVPDGTAVPSGTVFTIKPDARVDQGVVMALEKKYTVVR